MKFRKGDQVKVVIGKDKGKIGKIENVFPREHTVLVPGINMYKRHVKPGDPRRQAGIIDIVRPLPVTRVALLCPKCNQVSRVGFRFEDGKKIRVCRKCDQKI
jgi:large subunit ribosomal protein L24